MLGVLVRPYNFEGADVLFDLCRGVDFVVLWLASGGLSFCWAVILCAAGDLV